MKKLLITYITALMMFTTLSVSADTQEVENFVSRFYTEVLGRTADTAGLADWTNRLVSGESTGADVAFGFVFSAEFTKSENFKDDGVFLTILYRAFFNRDADTGGLNGWLEEIAHGTTKEAVLNGFLYSQEFANLCEAYGIKPVPDGSSPSSGGGVEDFVKRFYQVVLGRTADAGGLADWVSRLNAGTATGADIAIGFIFSAEYDIASKSNEEYLDTLYKAFFDRDADAGGLSGWLAQLMQGVSREDVLNGFLHSQEFVNLCEGYGIIAYTNDVLESTTITTTSGEVIKVNRTAKGLVFEGYEGKIVLLEVYGYSCPHCVDAIPGYNRLKNKYPDDVYIITVESYGISNTRLQQYVIDNGMQYDTVAKENAGMLISYFESLTNSNVGAGVPALLVLSRDGDFAKYFYPQDLPESQVDTLIQGLL